jgi:hypothetical protein
MHKSWKVASNLWFVERMSHTVVKVSVGKEGEGWSLWRENPDEDE